MQRCSISSGGNSSKGFYFSFDAMMAFTVLAASLALVSQSSLIASDSFDTTTVSYQKADMTGKDAMKLASRQDFGVFNNSFQQELVDNTAMDEEDLDRTVVDGVSLLWAARNFTYASEVTQKYFDSRIPGQYGYRLQVNVDGNQRVIYNTSEIPETAGSVTSISRLVSGHQIDRPSEGFQARARAVKSEANQTKVVNIPMMGSGGENLYLDLRKRFELNASEIHSAKIYFSAHWGQSNFQSNTVELNGQELDIGGSNSDDWKHYAEKDGTTLGYDTADITDQVQNGWNDFYLNFQNQNNHHVHIHPGTRIEVSYSSENRLDAEKDRNYFTNIEGEGQNNNKRGGAWITKPFYIPENASLNNISTRLNIQDVTDEDDRSDLEVYLNRDRIHAENLSGDALRNIDMTADVQKGATNILSVYVNTHIDDGEVTGFGGQPENPTIYSNPEDDPQGSSSLLVDYDSESEGLRYNRLEVVSSEEVAGSAENPKQFEEEFRDEVELKNAFVNLAQLDSRNVSIDVENQSMFNSPREFATPSKIGIEKDLIQEDSYKEFNISDECRVSCSILPQTSIEKRVLVPSQVGYGGVFESKSEAVSDAQNRLDERMGEYAEATEIDSDTLSTGNQPYLWGPASIKLVVWDE